MDQGNSGVYFHAQFQPGDADVSQANYFPIDCGANKDTGGVHGIGPGRRSWAVWSPRNAQSAVRQNDWNEMTVTVHGNHYASQVNGVKVVDHVSPHAALQPGPIALQLDEGGRGLVQFQDIWVRED